MIPVASGFAEAVANASAAKFAMFLGLGALVALAASWGAYRMLIRKRILQDTPTALIRSASQGYIELQGHVEMMDGDPIYAPLSMRTCIWYRYKVEEKQRRHTGSRWRRHSGWWHPGCGRHHQRRRRRRWRRHRTWLWR